MTNSVNAKIKRVRLGYEDHHILTMIIDLIFDGYEQSYGYYVFDKYDEVSKTRVSQDGFGMTCVGKLLSALDADYLDDLTNTYIRVLIDDDRNIVGIGHILKNSWFSFTDIAKEFYPELFGAQPTQPVDETKNEEVAEQKESKKRKVKSEEQNA